MTLISSIETVIFKRFLRLVKIPPEFIQCRYYEVGHLGGKGANKVLMLPLNDAEFQQ